MNKRFFALISIITIAILLGGLAYNTNKVVKGYDLNKVSSDILVQGDPIKGGEYSFHTFVKLGEEEPISSSIIELNLRTQIELDKETKRYKLKNAKLQVIPIGCEQYDKSGEIIDENGYSGNYQFGIKPNQYFNQTMDIGIAKALLDSKNVKINNIISKSADINIDSIKGLKRLTQNDSMVEVEFNTLGQSYTMWYNIKFKPTAFNEGIFNVF